MEVVLGEVMNNVVEHAYPCRASGYLSIAIDPAGDAINLNVEDNGAAMPNQVLPPGHPQDLDVTLHDLPEGGFGWLLIRELADDLRYERKNGRNLLTFSLAKSGKF
ncbi:Histidine kinase-like ATPase domain-containing protein [Tropicimonas isoalkanivorans]|uniref:Histidine kinase-like ATPase domain-containing protein n=1 Tax=Tropicimonas isoalkanivorans TaxID=441112 RepID=A0A1I1KTE7_9RHOB|nr:Histidine kinase-like ATPase domain-containing protein [Tropicimonas isoalkanivorans]